MFVIMLDNLKRTLYNNTCKRSTRNNIKKEHDKMTLEKLRQITNNLPADTIILVEGADDLTDCESVKIEYHADGRAHLILSNAE